MNALAGNNSWRPKPWIAAVLGFFFGGVGLLYVQRPWWGRPLACAVYAFRVAVATPQGTARKWYSRWPMLIAVPLATYAFVFLVRATIRATATFPRSRFILGDHIVGRVVNIVKEPIRR